MDLTGSIADATAPLSAEAFGSVDGATGSSAVDTLLLVVAALPSYLVNIVAGIGADLGSTTGTPLT